MTTVVRERVCRRGYHVREGENGRVRADDGCLVCYDCQKAREAAHRAGQPLPSTAVAPNSANPWSGRVACPDCDSSEWTMPYDPTVPDSSWRCVACHCWAAGPMRDKS